ncbi:carboxypeptidase-like regulatory domain-containing protein [bacterium]|nr:MAG: carboxypeptidase-like regulatory domain-containing protein [bacterium]
MRRFQITLIAVLIANSFTLADPGKIAGTVVDEYGDGVIGAAVQIIETSQGIGVMNLDGNYAILGIEPGVYTVRVSSIGYGVQVFKNVVVQEGLTTQLSSVLTEEVLQADEAVIEYQPPNIVLKDSEKPSRKSKRLRKPQISCPDCFGCGWRRPRPERVNTIGVPAHILVKYDFPTRVRYR